MLIGLHVQIHAQYGERGRLEIDQPFEQLCGSGFTGERILGVDWFSGSRHGFGQLTRLLQHAECQTPAQLTKSAPLGGDSETRTLKGPGEATWASRRAALAKLERAAFRGVAKTQNLTLLCRCWSEQTSSLLRKFQQFSGMKNRCSHLFSLVGGGRLVPYLLLSEKSGQPRRSIMTCKRVPCVLGILVVLGLAPNLCHAQTAASGAVLGTVTDPSGAVVRSAQIELINMETGAKNPATTSAQGSYAFPSVAPGTYRVTATAKGFRTTAITGLSVQVNSTSTVNVSLEVGEVTSTVEVSGAARQVEGSE